MDGVCTLIIPNVKIVLNEQEKMKKKINPRIKNKVIELHNKKWSNTKIAQEIHMAYGVEFSRERISGIWKKSKK